MTEKQQKQLNIFEAKGKLLPLIEWQMERALNLALRDKQKQMACEQQAKAIDAIEYSDLVGCNFQIRFQLGPLSHRLLLAAL